MVNSRDSTYYWFGGVQGTHKQRHMVDATEKDSRRAAGTKWRIDEAW
jgi:hypothetical protein